MSHARLLVSLLALATLGACTPTSVTFRFGGDPSRLGETAVLDEKGDSKVALIDVRGLIADAPRPTLFGTSNSPTDDLAARLARAAKDEDVKAVVLRISSPGGTVAGSDVMHAEVTRFREMTGKPVVMSFGEIATSGAYYLALAGDTIMTQETTITASIGVIIPTVNFSDGMARLGIEARSVKSGRNKDIANPLEPMRDHQYAILQGIVDDFYSGFRARVIEARPAIAAMTEAQQDELMDGRVVTGAMAVEVGLADEIGDLHDAFAKAKSLAGLERADLVKYHAYGAGVRSAYAQAPLTLPQADAPARTDVNVGLLQIDGVGTGVLSAIAGGAPGTPYFLWAPGL